MPAPGQQPQLPGLRLLQSQRPIAGDGVMNGGHQRLPSPLQRQSPVAEALVVVQHIVLGAAQAEVPQQPPPEGVGLGKAASRHAAPFEEVRVGKQMPRAQRRQVVVRREEVKRGQPHQRHPGVQLRVGRAGDHLHRMPLVGKRPGQELHIDPLPAGVGVAAVADEPNPQGLAVIRPLAPPLSALLKGARGHAGSPAAGCSP